jgi:hypothetical protein
MGSILGFVDGTANAEYSLDWESVLSLVCRASVVQLGVLVTQIVWLGEGVALVRPELPYNLIHSIRREWCTGVTVILLVTIRSTLCLCTIDDG